MLCVHCQSSHSYHGVVNIISQWHAQSIVALNTRNRWFNLVFNSYGTIDTHNQCQSENANAREWICGFYFEKMRGKNEFSETCSWGQDLKYCRRYQNYIPYHVFIIFKRYLWRKTSDSAFSTRFRTQHYHINGEKNNKSAKAHSNRLKICTHVLNFDLILEIQLIK